MDLLKGKTLIVTGASRGIGKALALELARAKANLVINARSTLLLAEVQRQCNNSGGSRDLCGRGHFAAKSRT